MKLFTIYRDKSAKGRYFLFIKESLRDTRGFRWYANQKGLDEEDRGLAFDKEFRSNEDGYWDKRLIEEYNKLFARKILLKAFTDIYLFHRQS